MLSWLYTQKSDALEQAQARARERAREREDAQPGGHAAPTREGLVVEEVSAEEFLRLYQQANPTA